MGDTATTIGAISSLVGTATVAYVAISSRRAANESAARDRKADETRAALARTTAATAVGIAGVATKVDTNTTITEAIHTEVQAINGTTGVELLEAQEGRRIQEDIPEADRTHAERGYADRVEEHDTNPDRP